MNDESPTTEPVADPGPVTRCRRCRKIVVRDVAKEPAERADLCYWCAYVDTQG